MTENSGEVTIGIGESSVTVLHSLSITPLKSRIQITPLSNLSPDGIERSFWVESITDISFVIKISEPWEMDYDLKFGWHYINE